MQDDLELIRLKRRFERHLDDYRQHMIDHVKREDQILHEQENTAKAIANLAEIVKQNAEATRGLVDVWNAANTIRRAVIWCTGFSGAVVFVAWVTDLIKIGG